MAWYSLLPTNLAFIETWVIRICLFLAVLNLLPWLIAILYDILLYIFRTIWYEVGGGRARGEGRPRAPSMRDRTRRMSLVDLFSGGGSSTSSQPENGHLDEVRKRHKEHQRNRSAISIEEEPSDAQT